MEITYNNFQYGDRLGDLLTFTDVPNILKIVDNTSYGSSAVVEFTIKQGREVNDMEFYFEGDTIKTTIKQEDAIGTTFYWGYFMSPQGIALSLYNALLNCPNVISKYNIYITNSGMTVRCVSYDNVNGSPNVTWSGDWWSSVMDITQTEGTTSGEIAPYSRIIVNMYSGDTVEGGTFYTTLEKAFYKGEIKFNLTPVIATMVEEGEIADYSAEIFVYSNNIMKQRYLLEGCKAIYGYSVNQGVDYMYIPSLDCVLAQNVSRGESQGYENNTRLYVYKPNIQVSILQGGYGNRVSMGISYLNSIGNSIKQTSSSYTLKGGLNDINIPLDEATLKNAYYVTVSFGGKFTLKYDVIKPLKATQTVERIEWRNEYGGISFFDFTSERTESVSVSSKDYNSQMLTYYENGYNGSKHIYDKTVELSVSIKSHLIDKNGIYIFNSLRKSTYVYTTINNKRYVIDITNVQVNETDVDNVYQATITYKVLDTNLY